MKTTYETRFICYKYNSGKADNGYCIQKETFDSFEKAESFRRELYSMFDLQKTLNSIETDWEVEKQSRAKLSDFIGRHVWDGFLHKYDGIYKITEEKVA